MKVSKLPKNVDKKMQECVRLNVATNIKLARKKVGLSQKELSEMLGYDSAVALSLIESGKRNINAQTLWFVSEITQEPINNFYLQGLI